MEHFRSAGYCMTCGQNVEFVARFEWFRDHFLCTNCGSIPRERALILAMEKFFPDWRDVVVHESSPGGRGASVRIRKDCPQYISSQFMDGVRSGESAKGIRCENLEDLSFSDESIDLHVTQDVMEHVFDPDSAFREIARTLKPGGMHIFTVPLVNKDRRSRRRAKRSQGQIENLEPEMYHGNPVGDGRSLVTMDWGFDICSHIHEACGLFTHIFHVDDLGLGIRAEFIEVLITVKPSC